MVAHGDEAFSQEMAIHFDNAKRLYHQKLLPVLEKQHGRREELEQLPYDDPKRAAFRNDDRLVKTLLLSALVPEVESLRALNAERLAALNHGTIKTPIPGREGQEVLRRCRDLGGERRRDPGRRGDQPDDLGAALGRRHREHHRAGARARTIRATASAACGRCCSSNLGIEGEGEFEQYHEFLWRNTKRTCVVLFRNIRELPDSSLENHGATGS